MIVQMFSIHIYKKLRRLYGLYIQSYVKVENTVSPLLPSTVNRNILEVWAIVISVSDSDMKDPARMHCVELVCAVP